VTIAERNGISPQVTAETTSAATGQESNGSA
jgi:hypothetical protein